MRRRLDVSELDFDQIKSNLKSYMQNQDYFKDFDFEGSALNILLDVLAVNTHYTGFYSNMTLNEAFIDSAASRRSVTSIAKHLGYTPRSVQSARAQVNIDFGSTRPTIDGNNFDYLPTGTTFRATYEGDVFSFLTKQPYKLEYDESDEKWYINDVIITEGVLDVQNFIYDSQKSTHQKFVLNNSDIDTSTLVVRVQSSVNDAGGFSETWNKDTHFSSINSDSRVYFLEENSDGVFQIYFGDGVLGRSLTGGNYITVQYLKTRGSEANGIGNTDTATRRTFSISGFSNTTVTVSSAASGGALVEGIESIRFNAPKAYQAQRRAVTSNDYETIVSQSYGEADSIFVYGGEDADPPQYGKVFVSIKPSEGTFLTALEKLDIANNVLKNQNVLGIVPEVIDPDYVYLKVDSAVTYDPSQTTLSETGVESLISSRINTYASTQLEKFDKNFYLSAFTGYIDDTNSSILANETDITIEKRLEVDLGSSKSYTVNFNNQLFHPEDGYKPILSSESFTIQDSDGTTVTGYLDDDGSGNVRVYKLVNDTKVVVYAAIGTVDYTSGQVTLVDFSPITTNLSDSIIKISVEPNNQNITTKRNMILLIDPDDVTVSATQKTVVDSSSLSGTPFPFNT